MHYTIYTWIVASALGFAAAFTTPQTHKICSQKWAGRCTVDLSLSNNDDWGMEDEDPRMKAMRSMLENSWNGNAMGTVPSDPEKAAVAAAELVALAMGKQHNILMIDLRLPSYDITEGSKFYDKKAVYDFCSYLSDQLRERNLIRKSLILVRNEEERRETVRASQISMEAAASAEFDERNNDNDMFGEDADTEVAEFRQKLMNSWGDDKSSETEKPLQTQSAPKPTFDPNSSHRLWSMIGNEQISNGSDMFEQVITAVDKHAILKTDEQEDALIIVSPYDTADVIALRRTLARYGQTRTIIVVNSRIKTLPIEMKSAVLVYGVLPLVARKSGTELDEDSEPGLKVVVMKRFNKDWGLFVDMYGEGFVQVDVSGYDQPRADSRDFPPPEWIARNVQAHVEGLSR